MGKKIETSRVLIHADNADREGGNHPEWRGDEAIADGEFAEEENAMSEINSRLERMLDKAPSDSTANLLVRRTRDGGYKAFLRIRSVNQRFKAFISGKQLRDVVERVIKDVRGQIDEWKENRELINDRV